MKLEKLAQTPLSREHVVAREVRSQRDRLETKLQKIRAPQKHAFRLVLTDALSRIDARRVSADLPRATEAGEVIVPLREHFRSPVNDHHAWNELHAMWPAMIVQYLYSVLPVGFAAAPSVHLGAEYEIDIGVLEESRNRKAFVAQESEATTAVVPSPTLTIETDLSDQDEFEVRVYDIRHGRRLVAAIELVSPRNKDRPESRHAFVGKVAALLQNEICVSIVDLVTISQFSLYAELLSFIGKSDPSLGAVPPHIYAVTLHARERLPQTKTVLDLWHYPMTVGQPLPTLPIWLEPDLRILLPLDTSYEEACKLLHIAAS